MSIYTETWIKTIALFSPQYCSKPFFRLLWPDEKCGMLLAALAAYLLISTIHQGIFLLPGNQWPVARCSQRRSARCSNRWVRVLCISWNTAAHSSALLLGMKSTWIRAVACGEVLNNQHWSHVKIKSIIFSRNRFWNQNSRCWQFWGPAAQHEPLEQLESHFSPVASKKKKKNIL